MAERKRNANMELLRIIAMAMIVVLLYGFDITLTLPGVAGIILSIGMAVDANVIIFARIREELATGKTVGSAMKIGFDKALSAIIDGNVTTLIAAAVLAVIGSGSVKGFAYTLALGIVLSLFTSLVVTRMLLNAFYTLGCKNAKFYGVAKERKTINFLSKKAVFFAASAAVVVAGFVINHTNIGTFFRDFFHYVNSVDCTEQSYGLIFPVNINFKILFVAYSSVPTHREALSYGVY